MPSRWLALLAGAVALLVPSLLVATPANKKALETYLGPFRLKAIDCRYCHVPDPPGTKLNLDEVDKPHNPFGRRLKTLRKDLSTAGKPNDLESRLHAAAQEDSDGDGVSNLIELLTGHNPGEAADKPAQPSSEISSKLEAFAKFQQRYRWKPFEPVTRPPLPPSTSAKHSIDVFIDVERSQHGLQPRPPAPKEALLRRLYVDLIGLPPTHEERAAFLANPSPKAYEEVVDRLLADPRHAERWARHWMDVWRYSDWAGYGKEVRESQPHIWRWRDWIVDSLHADKGYDQMVREMLAGDELAPEDPNTVRATGFLVRNWFRFNRNVWLDQTVEHTAKAFLGVTMNCCRCHDHMYDPFKQSEYYAFRAFFEPYQVRTDRVPGQANTELDGLARVYDADLKVQTFLLVRGNEAMPDKDQPCEPRLPRAIHGPALDVKPVPLPRDAYEPDQRTFILKETLQAADARLLAAEQQVAAGRTRLAHLVLSNSWTGTITAALYSAHLHALETDLHQAELLAAQLQQWRAKERLRRRSSSESSVDLAFQQQLIGRQSDLAEARKAVFETCLAMLRGTPKQRKSLQQQLNNAEQALAKVMESLTLPLAKDLPKMGPKYPSESSGRRLALAKWITARQNPLAARVAVNHVWLRHFGQPLVPTVFDFGGNGQPPTHPALLDWLANQFMEEGWSFKKLHKHIVMSDTYRMDSTPDSASLAKDPENRFYWRRLPQRLEAESVRDTLLYLAGRLDPTRGGPELDHEKGLTTTRRSLYYRHANEKQMVFLTTFDAAGPTECYRRVSSVVPQQALALANSSVAQESGQTLARQLSQRLGPQASPTAFVTACFEHILGRAPSTEETDVCLRFLREQEQRMKETQRARTSLVQVLFNHHEFVTVR
jgi:hypothetical protein